MSRPFPCACPNNWLGTASFRPALAGGERGPRPACRCCHPRYGKEKTVTNPTSSATPIPIVDTHQHLWDLRRFRLPWLQDVPQLDRSFLAEDYRQATAGLNVVKSIYMEVDLDPAQQVEEAEYVIDLCTRGDSSMVAAVIAGRPASPVFKTYISRFAGVPYVKGVRQVLHVATTPPGYCLDPQFVRGIQLLGELGMSFDLCMRSPELQDGVQLVDACPHTRFILDHCGNASVQAPDLSQWQKDIAALAARQNVVCKVSGIVASAKPGVWRPADLEPIVKHVLREFGPDRVLFGGDWPVCTLTATYRQWVEALWWIVRDLGPADQRQLFHDNAVRFYGLE
ncbi:MAG: amidohydrolase family protein [Armatimonadetes bacterium]|nr:amidohydrolase family protein [Armatimonadota bacterium]